MNTIKHLKTTLEAEKYYKKNALVQRCKHLEKCTKFLIEQIKSKCTNGLYIGEILAETREIEKLFYELQVIEGKVKVIEKLEENKND